jgi:hypothetical protein
MNYSYLAYLKVLCSLITKFLNIPQKALKLSRDIHNNEFFSICMCIYELEKRLLHPANPNRKLL